MPGKKESNTIKGSESITHVYGTDKFMLVGIVLTIGHLIPKTVGLWLNAPQQTFWQDRYESIYHGFGGNELYIISVGGVIFHLFGYWSMGTAFIIMDLTEKPAFLFKYKIKDEKYRRVTYAELLRLSKQCLFNQIFISSPFATSVYFIMKWRGCSFSIADVPGFTTVVLQIFIHMVMFEMFFYYSHRILHLPLFYKHFHKRHHEWTSPVAVASFYLHPVDLLLSVYLPILSGILVTGCHANLVLLWVYLGVNLGVLEHIGYKFPLYPSPELHTLHHETFTEFYGASEIFDIIHNTNTVKKSISPLQ